MRSRQISGCLLLIEDITFLLFYVRILYVIFKLKLPKQFPSYILIVNHGIAECLFLFIYLYFWACMAAYDNILPIKYTIYVIGFPFEILMQYVQINVAFLALSRWAFLYDGMPNVADCWIVSFLASRNGSYVCVAFSWILTVVILQPSKHERITTGLFLLRIAQILGHERKPRM